ncbi:hypothetical protein B0H67DRAFT_680108 [Lasiosphaeris hirsuta]|uniref:Uncharacterized protein n=1 Tax=Lasiosphaeris hirsuta TaxID=260670 RepID=A0AA40AYW3_9PEZI|nr:hypothetical protein B0H67DRAFT_680108 [Lasiosphaeris hirsuta]
MGCVMLEIIIWLVYGYPSVKRFRSNVRGQYRESVPCYALESSPDGRILNGKLQPIVERWLSHIAGNPICADDTALGELIINLVRSRLLVVELPPFRGQTFHEKSPERDKIEEPSAGPRLMVSSPTVIGGNLVPSRTTLGRQRATSVELAKALEQIMDDEDRPYDYWLRQVLVRVPAPDFDLAENPLNASLKVLQDAAGYLTPGLAKAGGRHLDSFAQDPKFKDVRKPLGPPV